MRSKRSDDRFTAAMHAVGPDLLAYFERRVGADGADLLTETMLIAWRKNARLPESAEEIRMWMFAIARNVLRNGLRSSIRRSRATEALHALTSVTARLEDPTESIAIRDLIDRLDPDLAEVLLLTQWEGFSLAEIAQLLNIPASTVRGRCQRAKAEIRRNLATSVD